jgi:hypothetical protein
VTHVNAITPTGELAHLATIPVTIGSGNDPMRLDRLAPLIHQLLAWDLIYRSEAGAFLLRDDVQERLQTMAESLTPATAEVYLGRKCPSCGLVRVTRLVNGTRVCEPCRVAATAVPDPTPVVVSEEPGHHGIRSRWHRKAS